MYSGNAITPEGPVGAGIDSILIQDGKIVSYASGINYDQDWELEGIRTLGHHGDRYFKSLGYTGRFTIETFLLRGQDMDGSLITPGWQPDGSCNINTSGLFDFAILDLHSFEVLATMVSCKISNDSVQFPARGLNTKSTQWRTTRILPGIQSS